MKHVLSLTAAVLLLFSLLLPAMATEVGEQVDWVLYTDIVTYIDGCPIRSYNIGGYTYVVAEDLARYGFAVEWLPAKKKLSVLAERTGLPDSYRSNYEAADDAGKVPGDPILPVLHTDIVTEIRGKGVTSCNIGGYTCIGVDDLAAHFAAEYVWDGEARTLSMTTRREESWNFVYETPEYRADTPVSGEYALWEFTKNESGEFALTHSEGSTEFTPRLTFGASEVTVQVPYVAVFAKGGARLFESAPHRMDPLAHVVHAGLLLQNSRGGDAQGAIRTADGGAWIYPERYRSYCEANEEYAAFLREKNGDARRIWQVQINGEAADGLVLEEPRPFSDDTVQTFAFRFGKLYGQDEVNTVRIGLRLPLDTETPVTETDSSRSLLNWFGEYVNTTPHDVLASFIFRIRDTGVTVHIETDEKAAPFVTCIERDGELSVFSSPLSLADALAGGFF